MEVERISNTIQRFNGVSYYLCGYYFQRKGERLHRTVWKYHNGEIPEGYDIHHIDGDRSNNSIENLALIEGREHGRLHMTTPERVEKSRETIKKASEYAKEWHKSEEGRAWHRKQNKAAAEARKANPTYYTFKCAYCGKEFTSTCNRGGNRYCCSNHKTYHVYGRSYENSREAKMRKG